MFKLNDRVVYPSHGVFNITHIDDSLIKLKGIDSQVTIMLRVNQIDQSGLRHVASEFTVRRALDIVKSKPNVLEGTWNTRYRAMLEMVKSGDLLQIAEVIRDLNHLKDNKDLSFGERKMLSAAVELFNSEVYHD